MTVSRGIFSVFALAGLLACSSKPKTTNTDPGKEAENAFEPKDLEEVAAAMNTAIDPAKGTSHAVAMVTNSNSTFWTAFQIGAGRAGSKIGCPQTVLLTLDSLAPSQLTLLNTAITEKSSGLGVSPIPVSPDDDVYKAYDSNSASDTAKKTDSDNLFALINAQVSNGTAFTTFDSDFPTSNRSLYIGTDNTAAGAASATALLKVMPTGTVQPFSSLRTENVLQRIKGFTDTLAGTGVTVLPTVFTGTTPASDTCNSDCRKQGDAKLILDGNATLGAIATFTTSTGPAVVNALKAASKDGKVKFVALDASSATLQALQDGTIQAIVAQRSYWEGYLTTYALFLQSTIGLPALKTVLQSYLKGPNGDLLFTGIDILTADNLAEYQAYLESIGILSQ